MNETHTIRPKHIHHLVTYQCILASSVKVVVGVVEGDKVSKGVNLTHISTPWYLGALPPAMYTGAVGCVVY